MKPHTKRLLALIAFLVLAASAMAIATGSDAVRDAASAPGSGKPNIILILTDDQDLILGSMDALPQVHELLAKEGTTFANAFVPLSLCCPSRSSILTSLYTHNTQIYTNTLPDGGFQLFRGLGHENRTIGVALQAAGYRTALMGKYLNDYPKGVDPTYVPPGWNEWDVPAIGDAYYQYNYTMNQNGLLIPHGNAEADYLDDVITQRARGFINEAAVLRTPSSSSSIRTRRTSRLPRRRGTRSSSARPRRRAPRRSTRPTSATSRRAIRGRRRLNQYEMNELDKLYRLRLRSLKAVDEAIARLIDLLEKNGQLDNTYIIFTSDNGFHLGQHRLLATKYTPYEEDIRVPLIVRGPGVRANKVVKAFVENIDLAPTIAELAGATMPAPVDGRSFVPFLRGTQPAQPWRQQVYLEQFKFREVPGTGVQEPADGPTVEEYPTHLGLRTMTYKFVEYSTGEREYYDLVNDRYELQNLAPKLDAQLLAKLTARVHALSTCRGQTCRNVEAAAALPGLRK